MTAIHTSIITGAATIRYMRKDRPGYPQGTFEDSRVIGKSPPDMICSVGIFYKGELAMNFFTVSFFGHRMIDHPFPIEQRLEKLIRNLLNEKEYVDFLVGRSGDFDQYASSAVLRVRKAIGYHNSSLTLVLPYPTAEYLNNQKYFEDYYSHIEISDAASAAHHKAAYQIRNRKMVDRSDLIVCCIERENGGAWQTVEYAMEQGKTVINIAKEDVSVNLL